MPRPFTDRRRFAAAAALALAAGAAVAADEEEESGLKIAVDRRGAALVVDVSLLMPGSLAATWALLTDFEGSPGYVPNLKASKIVRREGNVFDVAQKSATTIAFMTFEFGSVRRFELVPMREMRTSLISGDFKAFHSTLTLAERGDRTLLVYHGEYVPQTAPPPIVGLGIIENHTRRHWLAAAAELKRRHPK